MMNDHDDYDVMNVMNGGHDGDHDGVGYCCDDGDHDDHEMMKRIVMKLNEWFHDYCDCYDDDDGVVVVDDDAAGVEGAGNASTGLVLVSWVNANCWRRKLVCTSSLCRHHA